MGNREKPKRLFVIVYENLFDGEPEWDFTVTEELTPGEADEIARSHLSDVRGVPIEQISLKEHIGNVWYHEVGVEGYYIRAVNERKS